MFEHFMHDLRLALRGLRRSGSFTAAAVLTLAVGTVGTTAMFALIQGVLLRPLPVRAQDRLLVAWQELRATGAQHWPFNPEAIETIRNSSRLFESVAGVDYNGAPRVVVVDNGSPLSVNRSAVTGDFFEVLGAEPILGRALRRDDDVKGAEHVMVITYGLWQRQYGGSRDVIGRRLMVNERRVTIVGVMPRDVEYPRGVDVWMTEASLTSMLPNTNFKYDLDLLARLRPGVSLEQAATELGGIIKQIEAGEEPGFPRGKQPIVRLYEDAVVGDVRPAMLMLFGAVALVLVIASANVANLLLMRGEARRSEIAVRAALGAGRGRLAQQILAESLLLALAAGAIGVVIAWWSLQALLTVVPEELPRMDGVRIDGTVLGFTVLTSFMIAAFAGFAPVLSSVRMDLVTQLRSGGRGAAGSASRNGRRALVVAQVALAVIIVAAAGLLTRSLLRLQQAEMGIAADRLVFVPLVLPQSRYLNRDRHLQFLDEAVARFEASPGIAAATPVNTPPFAGTAGWDVPAFTADGQTADQSATNPALNLESVHANYFETFDIRLIRGREFTRDDREKTPLVAIISEDVATRVWPGVDPIGKRIKFGDFQSKDPWRTVVGVAAGTRYRELAELRPTLYLPAEQFIVASWTLVLRTSLTAAQVEPLAREVVRAVDPNVEVMRIEPFTELVERPLARPRFNALLIGTFGAAALLLAAIGLYAVMAAFVRQRYTEIGVRVALGARSNDVAGLVLREGFRLAGIGAAIGLALSAAAGRLLRGLLFEVEPLDPASILIAACLLVGASAVASYLPARRATRVDPVALLRAD